MGFVQRMLRREARYETANPCPRCGVPAAVDAEICDACGWDLSDGHRAAVAGGGLREPVPDAGEDAASEPQAGA